MGCPQRRERNQKKIKSNFSLSKVSASSYDCPLMGICECRVKLGGKKGEIESIRKHSCPLTRVSVSQWRVDRSLLYGTKTQLWPTKKEPIRILCRTYLKTFLSHNNPQYCTFLCEIYVQVYGDPLRFTQVRGNDSNIFMSHAVHVVFKPVYFL